MSPLVTSIIGITGVVLGLIAYAALQAGVIRGRSYAYILMNIAASSLILVSLQHAFNMATLVSQICWIAISLYGLVTLYRRNRALHLQLEEAEMIVGGFGGLPPHAAGMLLRAGRWRDVREGEVLAVAEQVLGRLIWLSAGAARVFRGEAELARIGAGQFIGEVTVLSGAPATASVAMVAPGRVFEIEAEALKRLMARDDAINAAVHLAITSAMGQRLRDANRRPALGALLPGPEEAGTP